MFFCISFALFLHVLCFCSFSVRCSLLCVCCAFFTPVHGCRQVVGLFQKQRQLQNANKRDTRHNKKKKQCKEMQNQDAKNKHAKQTHPERKRIISRISSLWLSKILLTATRLIKAAFTVGTLSEIPGTNPS